METEKPRFAEAGEWAQFDVNPCHRKDATEKTLASFKQKSPMIESHIFAEPPLALVQASGVFIDNASKSERQV